MAGIVTLLCLKFVRVLGPFLFVEIIPQSNKQVMKYPEAQFETLVSALKELAKVIDLNSIHPCQLHYLVYQQGSPGQTHNWLYTNGSEIKRAHSLSNLEGWQKIVSVPESFELYPAGCNDDHIKTAVKRALKRVE